MRGSETKGATKRISKKIGKEKDEGWNEFYRAKAETCFPFQMYYRVQVGSAHRIMLSVYMARVTREIRPLKSLQRGGTFLGRMCV